MHLVLITSLVNNDDASMMPSRLGPMFPPPTSFAARVSGSTSHLGMPLGASPLGASLGARSIPPLLAGSLGRRGGTLTRVFREPRSIVPMSRL